MAGGFHSEDERESRLDHVLATYLREVDSGATPDRRALLTRHPEFFDELSDFFADRDQLEQITGTLRDLVGASDRLLALEGLDPPTHPEHLGRIGGYEVTDWLGQGGMGVVFKAFDETLNRFVAIKLLAPQWSADASARRRFTREAQAAAAISHPHVVTIHAVGEWRGRPYLVMEHINGSSLQERLRESGPLELKEILRIGSQVAAGLAAAHAQGLIHRDVKPGNIMLENDLPRVKLTDFGLARAVDDTLLTQYGTLAGTPQYMAPEQARGEPMDRRADLFSLGSVLYAMCTGRRGLRGRIDRGGHPASLRRDPAPDPGAQPRHPGLARRDRDEAARESPVCAIPGYRPGGRPARETPGPIAGPLPAAHRSRLGQVGPIDGVAFPGSTSGRAAMVRLAPPGLARVRHHVRGDASRLAADRPGAGCCTGYRGPEGQGGFFHRYGAGSGQESRLDQGSHRRTDPAEGRARRTDCAGAADRYAARSARSGPPREGL